MKNQYPFYTLCLALAMLTACSGEKKESASEKGVETVLPDTKNEAVSYTHLDVYKRQLLLCVPVMNL